MAETDIIHHNSEPDEKLVRELYLFLRDNVSPRCRYHCPQHTMLVLDNARRFAAVYPDISPVHRLCLLTAALFHDAGYAETYFNNEPAAAKLAGEMLPDYGYSPENIMLIQSLILATELFHEPQNLLEKILKDADMGHIGTPDYLEKSRLLKEEHDFFVKKTSLKEWFSNEINFLSGHRFHQPWLEAERRPHRDKAIAELQNDLANGAFDHEP